MTSIVYFGLLLFIAHPDARILSSAGDQANALTLPAWGLALSPAVGRCIAVLASILSLASHTRRPRISHPVATFLPLGE